MNSHFEFIVIFTIRHDIIGVTMEYELKWGNKTWLYALALGLGFGMAILLLMHNMLGRASFFNYYSPMLGYYVLLSICQSHYFRRPATPDMSGMFRQFVSIFGAIVIFFLNEMIMIHFLGIPTVDHSLLYSGDLVMSGHFTFIVFGFFIYGFDDFMFDGKLVGWMKGGLIKSAFWYMIIWILWILLYFLEGGLVQAQSVETFSNLQLFRMLGIAQWTIIMSLMLALVFKDFLPEIKMKSDYTKGLFLLLASLFIGALIAYICYALTSYMAPWDDLSAADRWHHVLYMGTFPLTPIILMGVYSNNFRSTEKPIDRVKKRLAALVPLTILVYFAFHLLIAEPERIAMMLGFDDVTRGVGMFGAQGGWHHHLDLYFNFTVSIIPLTHHWFCGRAGFLKEKDAEDK